MTQALSISSHVAYGPVGNSAAVPAMELLGLMVHAVPTIVLSCHPGLGRPAGLRVPARDLAAMLDALDGLGVLNACAGVMTGYFADVEQVHCIARTIRNRKKRNRSVQYLCDPVLGDDERGLYVPEPVAAAIRDELVPLADAITPNRFELEWLSGEAVADKDDATAAAGKLADAVGDRNLHTGPAKPSADDAHRRERLDAGGDRAQAERSPWHRRSAVRPVSGAPAPRQRWPGSVARFGHGNRAGDRGERGRERARTSQPCVPDRLHDLQPVESRQRLRFGAPHFRLEALGARSASIRRRQVSARGP